MARPGANVTVGGVRPMSCASVAKQGDLEKVGRGDVRPL